LYGFNFYSFFHDKTGQFEPLHFYRKKKPAFQRASLFYYIFPYANRSPQRNFTFKIIVRQLHHYSHHRFLSFIFSGTILRINIRKPAGLLKKRENFKEKRLSKLSFQQLYNI